LTLFPYTTLFRSKLFFDDKLGCSVAPTATKLGRPTPGKPALLIDLFKEVADGFAPTLPSLTGSIFSPHVIREMLNQKRTHFGAQLFLCGIKCEIH
jgi:hypothetical protein